MVLKTKKLTLLIVLIGLIGTFTSVIPQNTFADNNDPTGTCVITPGTVNNDDIHVVIVTKPTTTGIAIDATVTQLNARDDINIVLVSLIDGQGNAIQTAPGASADPNANPVVFMASFGLAPNPPLPDDSYTIVICYTTGFPNTVDLGTKHGDVGFAIIDTTPPVVTPSPDLTIIPTNNNPIPVTDPLIQEFLNPGTNGLPFATDLNPPNPVVTNNNVLLLFPINTMTTITFSATDAFGNTGTAQATITIGVPPPTAGCNGRMLDQTGATQEIEVCLDVPVRQAVCVLEILGGGALPYGTLNQGETSAGISLFLRNSGNAPAEIKVIAGDRNPLNLIPGFWLEPLEPNAPPFTARMIAAQTHLGVVDPNLSPLGLAGFYDGAESFPVSDTQRTILIPILDSPSTILR